MPELLQKAGIMIIQMKNRYLIACIAIYLNIIVLVIFHIDFVCGRSLLHVNYCVFVVRAAQFNHIPFWIMNLQN